jgi:hypothetical protein
VSNTQQSITYGSGSVNGSISTDAICLQTSNVNTCTSKTYQFVAVTQATSLASVSALFYLVEKLMFNVFHILIVKSRWCGWSFGESYLRGQLTYK